MSLAQAQHEERPQSANRPRFVIRPGSQSDEGFIARSWVDTARGSSRANGKAEGFTAAHYAFVARLIERCEIRVAAPPDDDTTIYGFSLVERGTIHLVYVKKAWRHFGIARALLNGFGPQSAFTTWSADWSRWGAEKYPETTFVPYWLEGLKNGE